MEFFEAFSVQFFAEIESVESCKPSAGSRRCLSHDTPKIRLLRGSHKIRFSFTIKDDVPTRSLFKISTCAMGVDHFSVSSRSRDIYNSVLLCSNFWCFFVWRFLRLWDTNTSPSGCSRMRLNRCLQQQMVSQFQTKSNTKADGLKVAVTACENEEQRKLTSDVDPLDFVSVSTSWGFDLWLLMLQTSKHERKDSKVREQRKPVQMLFPKTIFLFYLRIDVSLGENIILFCSLSARLIPPKNEEFLNSLYSNFPSPTHI